MADGDLTAGDWGSFRAYMIVDGSGVFKVRDSNTFKNITNVTLTTNTWYDAWIVADNSANTYKAYIQGGAITTQTQLKSGATGTFAFRNSEPGTADIANFQAPTGAGGFGDNACFIDDIYVDPSGENLGIPPPPAPKIYTQDFTNDGNSDTGFSSAGWSVLATLDASGLNADASDEVISAGISKNDYAFFAPHIGVLDNELFLAYTTHFSVNVEVSRIKSVNYTYIGDPTGAVYRVAVRIGGSWYAEATGTADTRSNPGPGGTYLSTQFAPASFAAAANWVTVQNAAVGDSPMALGAAPVGDLSGTVTAIGLLLDQGEGSGDHMRFDAFAVTADPAPEGTIIMVM